MGETALRAAQGDQRRILDAGPVDERACVVWRQHNWETKVSHGVLSSHRCDGDIKHDLVDVRTSNHLPGTKTLLAQRNSSVFMRFVTIFQCTTKVRWFGKALHTTLPSLCDHMPGTTHAKFFAQKSFTPSLSTRFVHWALTVFGGQSINQWMDEWIDRA